MIYIEDWSYIVLQARSSFSAALDALHHQHVESDTIHPALWTRRFGLLDYGHIPYSNIVALHALPVHLVSWTLGHFRFKLILLLFSIHSPVPCDPQLLPQHVLSDGFIWCLKRQRDGEMQSEINQTGAYLPLYLREPKLPSCQVFLLLSAVRLIMNVKFDLPSQPPVDVLTKVVWTAVCACRREG